MRRVSTPLWTSEEIVAATGGALHGAGFQVSGITFDSREVENGWLFVAMPGTVADGHEQNAVLGRVNRLLAGSADAIATAYPDVERLKPRHRRKVALVGNPVRESVARLGTMFQKAKYLP